jgi:hypothetical protein
MHVSDGTSYEVRQPELVLVTPRSPVVGRPEPDQPPPAAQRFSLVDLLHVTRLEPIEPTPSR